MLKFLQTLFLAIIAIPTVLTLYEEFSDGLFDNTTKTIIIVTLSVVVAVGIAQVVISIIRAKRK